MLFFSLSMIVFHFLFSLSLFLVETLPFYLCRFFLFFSPFLQFSFLNIIHYTKGRSPDAQKLHKIYENASGKDLQPHKCPLERGSVIVHQEMIFQRTTCNVERSYRIFDVIWTVSEVLYDLLMLHVVRRKIFYFLKKYLPFK